MFILFLEILDYITDRYNDILQSDELRDVSKLLAEAEQIISDMRNRDSDFDQKKSDARSANKSAHDTLDKVEQWNIESRNLTEHFKIISDSLNDTQNRLRDLQEKAEDALDRSDTADEKLTKLKAVIMDLQKNTAAIKTLKQALEKTIDKAEELTLEAEDFIKNATETFKVKSSGDKLSFTMFSAKRVSSV